MTDETLGFTFLHFYIKKEHYLLSISNIESVFLLPKLNAKKKNHTAMVGVLNYQGISCNIYDILNLFSSDQYLECSLDTSVILCKFHDGLVGFIVSDILETINLPAEDLVSGKEYIKYTYKHDFSAKVIDVELLIKYFKLDDKYEA